MLNHVEAPDGLPIAYVLSVRVADVVHHIDTGFDPEFADYSRALATLDAVRWATEQGLATVDLGIDADTKLDSPATQQAEVCKSLKERLAS